MITGKNVNDVQFELGKLHNLFSAMHILINDVDRPCEGYERRQFDALIGVDDAIADQIEATNAVVSRLHDLLRDGGAS